MKSYLILFAFIAVFGLSQAAEAEAEQERIDINDVASVVESFEVPDLLERSDEEEEEEEDREVAPVAEDRFRKRNNGAIAG